MPARPQGTVNTVGGRVGVLQHKVHWLLKVGTRRAPFGWCFCLALLVYLFYFCFVMVLCFSIELHVRTQVCCSVSGIFKFYFSIALYLSIVLHFTVQVDFGI